MAYVVRRITKAGTVSTTLVESCRDAQGRPRQRLLASLHGEPDTLRALVRLAVRRMSLIAERKELVSGKVTDDETGEVIDAASAREVIAVIDAKLAALAREQTTIKKHCTATARQIRVATRVYKRKLTAAVNAAMGKVFVLGRLETKLKKAKTTIRRMRGY